jgi:hypothetical protein
VPSLTAVLQIKGYRKMKKIIIALLAVALVCPFAFAGQDRTTPQYIVLTDPTTNHVELNTLEFHYGATAAEHYILIRYNIRDASNNIRAARIVRLDGSDFTDFVSGIGGTLVSNTNSAVWSDIQANYTTQATP